MSDKKKMVDELKEAAKLFYNLTRADPKVIIRCPDEKRRDTIVAAGERLRKAILLIPTKAEPVSAQSSDELLQMLTDAVIAMAEDGRLMYGPEGMSDAQQKCYDAYKVLAANEIAKLQNKE